MKNFYHLVRTKIVYKSIVCHVQSKDSQFLQYLHNNAMNVHASIILLMFLPTAGTQVK